MQNIMQINIQPGDNVYYKFLMHKKKPQWFEGLVLDKIHVQGESFTKRIFKVYFKEDKEVCDLLFDDEQYFIQWKILSPMSSESTQQTTEPISEQANVHIQAATDKARMNKMENQLSLVRKHFKHDPQTSAPEFKNILCNICFAQKKYHNNHAVIYIFAHALIKYMLGVNVDHIYTDKKARTFITKLKKKYGVCRNCATGDTGPLIRIDGKRFTNCCICKTKPGNKTFDLPVCNTCQQLSTNNTNESLLQALILPMIRLINSSANTPFKDAVMNINTTFPGLTRKPDATISFSYTDENAHKINILFLIEIDKKQHVSYSDENERTVEFLKSLKNHTTYDKAVMIRLNTDDYLDERSLSQEAPAIYTRHVILRCWLMYFFINSRKIPPFTCLYLFYSSNSTKLLKSSVTGFIGQTNFAPKNDSDVDNNWIYGLDLTEGEHYDDPKAKGHNTWGKYVSSRRVSVNKVFDVHNVIANLWTRWMHKDTLVSKLIADNE
jgi:hypothetical protein